MNTTPLPEVSALEAYDALTLKLSQIKGLTRLIRTSGLNSCLVSVTTCAGLLEDLVDLVDNDAAAVYLHATAARDLPGKIPATASARAKPARKVRS